MSGGRYIKQAQSERSARYHVKLRAFLLAAKDRPCADCGGIFQPCVMEFAHRDRSTKLFNLAAYTSRGMPAITAEIAKCDVLCANCHRIRDCGDRCRLQNGGIPLHLRSARIRWGEGDDGPIEGAIPTSKDSGGRWQKASDPLATSKYSVEQGAMNTADLDSPYWQKRRTHCPQGHEYTFDNTGFWGSKRSCLTCHRIRLQSKRSIEKAAKISC